MYEIIVLYTPPDGGPQKHLVNRYEFRDVRELADALSQLRMRADKVVIHDEKVIKSRNPENDPDEIVNAACGHPRAGYVEAGNREPGNPHALVTVCNSQTCIDGAMLWCSSKATGYVPTHVRDDRKGRHELSLMDPSDHR